MSFTFLPWKVHEDTYQMQQGLQERVQNWNRIRKGQGSIHLQRVLYRHLEKKLKQAETWLLKLGKFARMIDYMIGQNLVSILEDEITSFIANSMQVRWWVGWNQTTWGQGRCPFIWPCNLSWSFFNRSQEKTPFSYHSSSLMTMATCLLCLVLRLSSRVLLRACNLSRPLP